MDSFYLKSVVMRAHCAMIIFDKKDLIVTKIDPSRILKQIQENAANFTFWMIKMIILIILPTRPLKMHCSTLYFSFQPHKSFNCPINEEKFVLMNII